MQTCFRWLIYSNSMAAIIGTTESMDIVRAIRGVALGLVCNGCRWPRDGGMIRHLQHDL